MSASNRSALPTARTGTAHEGKTAPTPAGAGWGAEVGTGTPGSDAPNRMLAPMDTAFIGGRFPVTETS